MKSNGVISSGMPGLSCFGVFRLLGCGVFLCFVGVFFVGVVFFFVTSAFFKSDLRKPETVQQRGMRRWSGAWSIQPARRG